MDNYDQSVRLARVLVTQSEAYEERPTKAESKRIRATLNELKQVATSAKRDLMNADSNQ